MADDGSDRRWPGSAGQRRPARQWHRPGIETARSLPSALTWTFLLDATVIDAAGGWVLPGFIEAHGHVGVHEEAEGWAGSDTNELTEPVTAQVRALDAINPADLGFRDAVSAAACWQ